MQKLEKAQEGGEDASEPRPLDDRKLSHVRFAPDIEPQTPTSVSSCAPCSFPTETYFIRSG